MPEIVTHPDVPGPARRELEQTPVTALLGFGDPMPTPGAPGDPIATMDARTRTMLAARLVAGGSLALALVMCCVGLFAWLPNLVLMGMLIWLPVAMVSALIGFHDHEPGQQAPRRRGEPSPAVTYHRRYVVPELDLHDAGRDRWRRAREAAKSIQSAAAVREGLIDTVEITAVMPYHLWDIAERLALMSATERRLPAILHGVDTNDSEIQAILGPQRRVHDLAVADVEQRIGRLEEFAALAATVDAARRRKTAIVELAGLNPDYEELLVRLGETDNGLTVTGHSGDQLRAVAAEADDAVRRANEAGRALIVPSAHGQAPDG